MGNSPQFIQPKHPQPRINKCSKKKQPLNSSSQDNVVSYYDPYPSEFKIALVSGCSMDGKSQLAMRYVNNSFIDARDPTIEDYYKKSIDYNGKKILIGILDTGGSEEFRCMMDQWFKESEGIVFVYD
eukprot:60313_1